MGGVGWLEDALSLLSGEGLSGIGSSRLTVVVCVLSRIRFGVGAVAS